MQLNFENIFFIDKETFKNEPNIGIKQLSRLTEWF